LFDLGWNCAARLVDNALGKIRNLGLKIQFAEGLLVLGEVLPKNVPKGLGLLRTQVDSLVVLDAQLVGAFRICLAENQMEIPYAYADLDTVGVCVAISGCLDDVDAGLLRVLTHSLTRLLRRMQGRRYRRDVQDFRMDACPPN